LRRIGAVVTIGAKTIKTNNLMTTTREVSTLEADYLLESARVTFLEDNYELFDKRSTFLNHKP
jgi:hypothetical protein